MQFGNSEIFGIKILYVEILVQILTKSVKSAIYKIRNFGNRNSGSKNFGLGDFRPWIFGLPNFKVENLCRKCIYKFKDC